jgi:hypothetical protein
MSMPQIPFCKAAMTFFHAIDGEHSWKNSANSINTNAEMGLRASPIAIGD